MKQLAGPKPMNGLPDTEFYDFSADHVAETFRVFVGHPLHVEPGKRYPVIYVLDGNLLFTAVHAIHRGLTVTNELPSAFVVGIGYETSDFPAITVRRNRDLTPTGGGEHQAMISSSPEVSFGGAAEFLEVLIQEIGPIIEERYPVDAADSTIVGDSFGGLFASWVLLNRPELFQRYVLCSPAFWWHGEKVWDWVERCAKTWKGAAVRVFVTAGELETIEGTKQQLGEMSRQGGRSGVLADQMIAFYERHKWPRMAEITPEFAVRLRSLELPGMDVFCRNLPDETHMSVWPAGISRGLRYVFGAWKP